MLKKIKGAVENFPATISESKNKLTAVALATACSLSAFVVPVGAEDLQGWTSSVNASMFDGMFADIKALVPVLLPVIVSFLAFRKGWGFLKGQIKGA